MSHLVKAEVLIDTRVPEQIEAFANLLTVVGETVNFGGNTTLDENQEVVASKPKATRNRSKKVEAPAENTLTPTTEQVKAIEVAQPEVVESTPETAPAVEEEDDLMGDAAPESPAVTIVEIRALVSDKQAVHKEAIRAKLGELGAANVTALKETDYLQFYAFLSQL